MNEDLEQRNLPLHIFTHDRLLRMIERNQRRLGVSSSYITQNYNRFFQTQLTPNDFLNTINQDMVDELANRQIDPSMEGERRRLLVEIDRYRKIKAILREIKAMLMIMKYNRLTKERRRQLNIAHLAETGLTYVEDIDRTMPVYPFYFRGLRTIIPQDDTERITFNSVAYENYRLLGGNVITLGGVVPETLINPILVSTRRNTVSTEIEQTQGVYHGHTRDMAEDYYDLDDLRPTGREREESIRKAEELNEELRNRNNPTKGGKVGGDIPPTPAPTEHSLPTTTTDKAKEEAQRKFAEWKYNAICNTIDLVMKYKDDPSLTHMDEVELRQTLPGLDVYMAEDYGTVLDALGSKQIDKDEFFETVERLKKLLEVHDVELPLKEDIEGVKLGEVEQAQQEETGKYRDPDDKEITVEELQKVEKDADVETLKRIVELGRLILKVRFKEDNNTLDLVEGLLDEYDTMRLDSATAELIRTMNSIDKRIPAKVEKLRARLNEFNRRGKLDIPDMRNDVERLKDMINQFPDPNMVIFNHDVEAFQRMARIMELYHTIKTDPRFAEKPVMKLSNETKLTRVELDRLKRIFQAYREIYANESLREAFLHKKEEKQL